MKRVSSPTGGAQYNAAGASSPAQSRPQRTAASSTSNNPFLRSRSDRAATEQAATRPAYQHAATQTEATPIVPSSSATAAAPTVDATEAGSSVAEAVLTLNRLRQSFPALLDQAADVPHIHPVDNVRASMDRALADASRQIDMLLLGQGLRADLRAPMIAALQQEVRQAFDQAARTFRDAWFDDVETHSNVVPEQETQPLLGHSGEASRAPSRRSASPLSGASNAEAVNPPASGTGHETPPRGNDLLFRTLVQRGLPPQQARQVAGDFSATLERAETAPAQLESAPRSGSDRPGSSRASSAGGPGEPNLLETTLRNRGMSEQEARATVRNLQAFSLERRRTAPEG